MGNNQIKMEIELSQLEIVNILGQFDSNLPVIEKEYDVRLTPSDKGLTILGSEEKVSMTMELIESVLALARTYKEVSSQDLTYIMEEVKVGNGEAFRESINKVVVYTDSGRMVRPKTIGQQKYVNAMESHDVIFGIGPAGTGKTYLAMAMAVKAFKDRKVNRIILTRPAVEAGESLGFLPGDLQTKVDPYLRPLYDALFDIMGYNQYQRFVEKGMIEVAPLAYMRGRTLDNSFVILDEAQNTTNEQMKMFLTRLGYGSKAVITGDITQIDLPKGKKSGLVGVQSILRHVKGLSFVYLDKADIVRHPMVQRIIDAYERHDEWLKAKGRENSDDKENRNQVK